MTYLTLCAMLTSRLNDDPLVLSQQKGEIIFKRYGVLSQAQKEAPGPLVVKALGAKDKMKTLDSLMRQIFKDAGENYP